MTVQTVARDLGVDPGVVRVIASAITDRTVVDELDAVEHVDPLMLADRWFHDHPPPSVDPASPVADQDG